MLSLTASVCLRLSYSLSNAHTQHIVCPVSALPRMRCRDEKNESADCKARLCRSLEKLRKEFNNLLAAGADPRTTLKASTLRSGSTLLHQAVHSEHEQIVALLLSSQVGALERS